MSNSKQESYTDDLEYDKSSIRKEISKQFTIDGSNNYFPCANTVSALPNGYYKIRKDYTRGIFFKKITVNLNKLVRLTNSNVYQNIMDDVTNFWNTKEEYLKRDKIYRRNILLYSAPGMGKTSIINLIISDLINKRDGIVLSLTDNNDIINFSDGMEIIRTIMPDKPIIAIIEDIDTFINNEIETELLDILDGIRVFDNIIIIATTNYPEVLTERYINRPSRFNRIISIPYPNDKVRREFIEKINLQEDLEKINIDKWVEKTEGYSIDFLKELCDCVFINGVQEDEAFKIVDEMIGTKIVKNSKEGTKTKIGLLK